MEKDANDLYYAFKKAKPEEYEKFKRLISETDQETKDRVCLAYLIEHNIYKVADNANKQK